MSSDPLATSAQSAIFEAFDRDNEIIGFIVRCADGSFKFFGCKDVAIGAFRAEVKKNDIEKFGKALKMAANLYNKNTIDVSKHYSSKEFNEYLKKYFEIEEVNRFILNFDFNKDDNEPGPGEK